MVTLRHRLLLLLVSSEFIPCITIKSVLKQLFTRRWGIVKNKNVETFDIPLNRETFEALTSLKKDTIPILFSDMETALKNRLKALRKAGA